MICLKNVNISLLKNFLGIDVEIVKKDNKSFINIPVDCTIEKDGKIIKIKLDKEYKISITDGDYFVIDYKSSKDFHRYLLNLNGEKGIFIFKKCLNTEELLHFMLSIFFIEKLIEE
ncbi:MULTISPECIES: hypothetical protein [Thermosipho]|uniref:Uncharacterized protein n=1 Tax=Thermosipho affectus TaxID=660294 RepID=A0ABX3IJT4_9BACT|nr:MULTISPECIES: hypothetical protein [Thermosipho]ANQ53615.1 hypothetical protein Y592_03950 [Thermosipho sp. 1070]APT72062.1 hypothetical protein BG95_03900 [Thermosipho sp. 1063]MBT1247778.1 hypothetical protein [Thermosipho sp. 1244]ONN27446.1 hypothetical protein XJ44_03790 [Thermosipho affectus]OOC44173.1 hypothetical protein XO08_03835 [Thermosipho sp. 1074]